jgi:hypothetical protein
MMYLSKYDFSQYCIHLTDKDKLDAVNGIIYLPINFTLFQVEKLIKEIDRKSTSEILGIPIEGLLIFFISIDEKATFNKKIKSKYLEEEQKSISNQQKELDDFNKSLDVMPNLRKKIRNYLKEGENTDDANYIYDKYNNEKVLLKNEFDK